MYYSGSLLDHMVLTRPKHVSRLAAIDAATVLPIVILIIQDRSIFDENLASPPFRA